MRAPGISISYISLIFCENFKSTIKSSGFNKNVDLHTLIREFENRDQMSDQKTSNERRQEYTLKIKLLFSRYQTSPRIIIIAKRAFFLKQFS